jgi:hypothetical protein
MRSPFLRASNTLCASPLRLPLPRTQRSKYAGNIAPGPIVQGGFGGEWDGGAHAHSHSPPRQPGAGGASGSVAIPMPPGAGWQDGTVVAEVVLRAPSKQQAKLE